MRGHTGDYTREEKIAMTAAALGIAVPSILTMRSKTRVFYPLLEKKETAVDRPIDIPVHQQTVCVATVTYNRIADGDGWGAIRKQAMKNLQTVTVCSYCGVDGTELKGPDGRSWHIDHIVPSDKNGSSEMDNLCKACHMCNVKKHTKLIRPLVGTVKADGSIEGKQVTNEVM